MSRNRRFVLKGLAGLTTLGGTGVAAVAEAGDDLPNCKYYYLRAIGGWWVGKNVLMRQAEPRFRATARTGTYPPDRVFFAGARQTLDPTRVHWRFMGKPLDLEIFCPPGFIIDDRQYEFTSGRLDDGSFFAFVRLPNGRLARPSAEIRLLIDDTTVYRSPVYWGHGRSADGRIIPPHIEIFPRWPQVQLRVPAAKIPHLTRMLEKATRARLVLVDHEGKMVAPGGAFFGVTVDLADFAAAYRASASVPPSAVEGKCDDCYITTACCTFLGRPDDCWELETLRRYRDQVLTTMPGGPRDIQTYYETAPTVVARLNAMGWRGSAVLLQIYFLTILPSVVLIRLRCHALARALYSRMFRKLTRLAEREGETGLPATGHLQAKWNPVRRPKMR